MRSAAEFRQTLLELTFQTDPIIGWRAWRIVTFERHGGIKEPRLQSLTGRELFEPMAKAEAKCLPQQQAWMYGGHSSTVHEAPWPSCSCGIWATRERADVPLGDALRNGERGTICVGTVSLWGRVLEFKRGWRGRYAYPKSLILLGGDKEMAADLARVYGVPVECEAQKEATASYWIDDAVQTYANYVTNLSITYLSNVSPAMSQYEIDREIQKANSKAKAYEFAQAHNRKTLPPPRPKPTARETFKRAKKLRP